MCDCNSKKDPKSSKNDKAKQTFTCKPTKFVLTFNGKYNDGSRKSVSVPFKSNPNNPTCDYPTQKDYEAAVISLLVKWNGEQLKLAKKYKAAGKAAPKLIKRSTSLVCPSAETTSCKIEYNCKQCTTTCDGGNCFPSYSICQAFYDPCYQCSSGCWVPCDNLQN